MKTWCHLPTISNHRHTLRNAVLGLLGVVIITTLLFAYASRVSANTARTVNFQGRLLTRSEVPVADGFYNMQFKLYQGGAGTAPGNPGGIPLWEEEYVNNGQANGAVEVKNGVFTVRLGSETAFGANVDWSQDQLWLSMNVAGRAVNCSSFGEGACPADGEMLPMKAISATPFALAAGSLGGKTADDFVQLGQGVQTNASNNPSIFIDTTGSGNLVQLQRDAENVFTVSNSGDIVFGGATNHNISIAQSEGSTDGQTLTIAAGGGGSGTTQGGNLVLSGGSGGEGGASGLVVLSTPTFSTVTNDTSCYANGAPVEASCSVSQSTVDNSSAVLIGFSETGQTATLPDPTITTPGRILYIMASNDTEDFTLSMNGPSEPTLLPLRKNTAISVLWNGSDWIATNGAPNELPISTGSATTTPNVQIGDGLDSTPATPITLDRSSTAPTPTDDAEAMLGSMYYDTSLGKLQCYEAGGWGSCGASPDVFVTLSPEFPNAVLHGTDEGDMTSDFCSDTLNINNGDTQPAVCGEDETHNFYRWTSPEITAQTKSIFVTYQLPASFKEFAPNSTSLIGRTDDPNSSVNYEIYRNSKDAALHACGPAISVSSGVETTWQTATATGSNDPRNCSFSAGDSIVFRINLSASEDANAYVSNLNFTYSNQ